MEIKLLIFYLTILLFFGGCNINNNDFNREHILYNEVFNPYFVIVGYPHQILDYTGNKQKINSYNIYMNTDELYDKRISEARCEIYSVNYYRDEELLYDKSLKPPFYKKIGSDMTVGGNGFREIYGRYSYEIDDKNYEITFSEPVLLFTDNKVSIDDYNPQWQNQSLQLAVSYDTEDGDYLFDIQLSFLTENRRHLDLQTWLVSPNEGVVSFFGIYKYCGGDNNLIYSELPADKAFNFNTLYVRANFWEGDEKNKILYKINLNNI